MRRAVLLYNPRSGSGHARRKATIDTVAAALRKSVEVVETEPTESSESARLQAQRRIENGFDTIIACGGDGTIHDVLQGVVGSKASLGVIPLGTANSLAQDLGLSTNPRRAAEQLGTAQSRRIAVGEIEYQRGERRETRYFTVAAGIGMDAALFYRINAEFKRRWGMIAYVTQSLRMWAFESFRPFAIEWVDSEGGEKREAEVTQLLVVRIANFGGVLNRLAPGADLLRDDLRLVLFKTSNKARIFRFATGRLIKQDWADPYIELVNASSVLCRPLAGAEASTPIYAEADGEILGRLPVNIRIVPDALNLLLPATATCLQSSASVGELSRR